MHNALHDHRKVLYVVTCGSSSAPQVYDFISTAQQAGWDVCSILTPSARKFVDMSRLAQMTKRPVRSEYKRPEEPDLFPRADALVVLPVTFNTLNKWALGISDTLAVGILCEYTGLHAPIVAIAGVTENSGLDTYPPFHKSIETLRSYGVHIIHEPQRWGPQNRVPADVILTTLEHLVFQ
uniref:Flavoprotein n=1 Tax=Thermosporothrix sp. COM3 TaxID=2490863 RepID=A0A455SX82_9CHLR|nr:flavoprotein [Thermosporothrix sp. COM3]